MYSPEQIPTVEVPNLNSISKKAGNTVEDMSKFVVEGVPQMEACVERNQIALNSFCIHEEVGIFSFDSTKNILPKLEK